MDCIDEQLGAFEISAQSPAGSSPREGSAYAAAQAEVDKLISIHAHEAVDWVKLAEWCAKILREEGKDFNVAVWLLCAWTTSRGLPGLASGIHVLRDMLERYWFTLTPPPSRLRARRNQAEWMLEWLNDKLSETFLPLPADQIDSLLEDWDVIDALWREQDPEAPGFFRLRRSLADLPVEHAAESDSEPAVEVPPTVSPAPTASSFSARAAEVPLPGTARAPPALALVEPIGNLEDDEAIEKAVTDVFASLTPLVSFCIESRATLPLLFRLNRQLAWITLDQAPPSQGNNTLLPPPVENQIDSFTRLQSVGEPLDILQFCESRLATYPFWLDLNRGSHSALLKLGPSAIAAAANLALETRHLLQRMPSLAELCFSNGHPFADGATRNWLDGLKPTTTGMTNGVDTTQSLIDDAGRVAAEGRLDDALSALQANVCDASSGRDRFRLRRAQCELLHRFDPAGQLRVALDVLLREAQEQGLDRWEPGLVRPLLELALAHDDGGSKTQWVEQLAAMDLPALWRLSRSLES